MKKHKKRGILCAIGAALFAIAIPQMDSSEPAEIVMAVVIVLVLAFLAVRFLFPNLRLRKKSKAAAAPHQREDPQQQRSFPVASRPLADTPAPKQPEVPKQVCPPVEPAPVAAPAQTVEQPRFIDVEALRRGIVRQPDAPKYQHYEFHVAGVTYKSEDGTPGRNICAESTTASRRLKIPTRWTCRSAHSCTSRRENPKNRRFPCV